MPEVHDSRDVDATEDERELTVESKVLLEDDGREVDDSIAATDLLEDLGRRSNKHAAEVLGRAVREHVALLDDAELVRLLDALHDETSLEEGGFAVIFWGEIVSLGEDKRGQLRRTGVVGQGGNDPLGIDVASFVHQPPRSWWRNVSAGLVRWTVEKTHIQGDARYRGGGGKRRRFGVLLSVGQRELCG